MKFKILTLFPEMFPGPIAHSISGKALSKKIFTIETYNIRNFTNTKSQTVDDTSYGGGPGMILKPDVLQRTLDAATKERKKRKIIYLSPGGNQLNSGTVNKLIKFEEIILICGRYEGVDERFIEHNNLRKISIGKYVLCGGEAAALIISEAVLRLLPDVLGNEKSKLEESFVNDILEYPHYTKPRVWNNLSVPEVLLSGNHKEIKKWRSEKALYFTKKIMKKNKKNDS